MKQDLKTMNLDNLFAEMQAKAINAHDVYVSGAPIQYQHQAVDLLNEVYEEIQSRGPDAIARYIPLLQSEHPVVRLQTALASRKVVPELAIPVLQDLSDGKYGGTIGANAKMTLDGMRKRGLLGPKSSQSTVNRSLKFEIAALKRPSYRSSSLPRCRLKPDIASGD